MAQDSRSVNDIINNAYYLLGEVSPDVIPSSSQVSRALYLLNDMLDSFSAEGVFIPTIKEITVNLIPGQATYSVSNIIPADFNFNRIVELDFVNIIIETVRYEVRIIDRAIILNNVSYPSLKTRPTQVFLDKLELQSNLTFYPTPDLNYEVKIRAKFMLDRLSLFQVITEVPPHYYKFLRYALARELSSYYPSASWNDVKEAEYQKMIAMVKAGTEVNLLIDPDNLLLRPFGYGINNIYYPL